MNLYKIAILLKKNILAIALVVGFLFPDLVAGQNVAINTTGAAPNSSAILDLSSTSLGLLIPRMTHTEMTNIVAPTTSMMVYSTTDNCFYFYTGSAWQSMHCTCVGPPVLSISGNATPCAGTIQRYTATLVSGSAASFYVWTVPAGAIIDSGQGGYEIEVTWGSTSGNVTLVASNSCGTWESTYGINVSSLLGAAGPITGLTAIPVCVNSSNYSVPSVSGVLSYTWSITPTIVGTSIVSGQGTNAISIDFGPTQTTYTLSVYDSDACGLSSSPATLAITTSVQHGTITHTSPGHFSWSVPCGITTITVTLEGASGGKAYYTSQGGTAGKGAKVVATDTVTPNEILDLYVGAFGLNAVSKGVGGIAGNGGSGGDESGGKGYGSATATWGAGGGGGGASSIRKNGSSISKRIFVAGGGGGAGVEDNAFESGGAGGTVGSNGNGTPAGEQGLGGTTLVGGAAVLYAPGGCSPSGVTSIAGALGTGGEGGMTTASTGNVTCNYAGGGGGGGGLYGGSGGCAGGGGGGSSYAEAGATAVTITSGANSGNGSISIIY